MLAAFFFPPNHRLVLPAPASRPTEFFRRLPPLCESRTISGRDGNLPPTFFTYDPADAGIGCGATIVFLRFVYVTLNVPIRI